MCTFSTFRSGFFTRLIFKTSLNDAVIKLLAAYPVLSMYAEFQHSCVPYVTSHTINAITSLFQAVTTIRERLMCRQAVPKVWLLFESGFYSNLASVEGGLY